MIIIWWNKEVLIIPLTLFMRSFTILSKSNSGPVYPGSMLVISAKANTALVTLRTRVMKIWIKEGKRVTPYL